MGERLLRNAELLGELLLGEAPFVAGLRDAREIQIKLNKARSGNNDAKRIARLEKELTQR